ncbi:MAG: cyclic lactone autoinducer peptide [Clostridia bacterium]
MKNNKKRFSVMSLIPKAAKALGQNSVDAACCWWVYQPVVPAVMKKSNEEKSN